MATTAATAATTVTATEATATETTLRRWPCLIDTNVLVYAISNEASDRVNRQLSEQAIAALLNRGNPLYVSPLILMEFWNVATRQPRPGVRDGLGMSVTEARAALVDVREIATCLPDLPAIQSDWEELIERLQVIGPDVYDAYIAATVRVHPDLRGGRTRGGAELVPRLLTFNVDDFRRFDGFRLVQPREIVGAV